MDQETREMFNAVIGEIDKLGEKLNAKIDKRFSKLDEKIDHVYESLSHEINACKLNQDTTTMLVEKTVELDRRVSALEAKKKKREGFRLL